MRSRLASAKKLSVGQATFGGVQKIKELAVTSKANTQAMDIICCARKQKLTLQQIADKLNSLQYTNRKGKLFAPTQVSRLLQKCVGSGVIEQV